MLRQCAAAFSATSMKASASSPPLSPLEGFLSGASAGYIEDMYAAWLKDPASVHVSWASYFKNLGSARGLPFVPPPNLLSTAAAETLGYDGAAPLVGTAEEHLPPSIPSGEILDHMKVQLMVRAYQVRGHHLARLDPLGINIGEFHSAPELTLEYYGFSKADLDRTFFLGKIFEPLLRPVEPCEIAVIEQQKKVAPFWAQTCIVMEKVF